MSKDPLYEHLREVSWQRKLTREEEAQLAAWLAAHPEDQSDWDSELNLNRVLAALPNVPVASNFTARVLDAAKRESAGHEPSHRRRAFRAAWWLRWWPKAALATAVLLAGLFSYHYAEQVHRQEVARSLTAISQMPSVPNPEILKDFDTIAALGSTPPADEELLRVMQ